MKAYWKVRPTVAYSFGELLQYGTENSPIKEGMPTVFDLMGQQIKFDHDRYLFLLCTRGDGDFSEQCMTMSKGQFLVFDELIHGVDVLDAEDFDYYFSINPD